MVTSTGDRIETVLSVNRTDDPTHRLEGRRIKKTVWGTRSLYRGGPCVHAPKLTTPLPTFLNNPDHKTRKKWHLIVSV